MRQEIAASGTAGLVLGLLLYGAASLIGGHLPLLLEGTLAIAVSFLVLLFLDLAEVPLMVLGIRHMAFNASTHRFIILGANTTFVVFAFVYAAIFHLLTGEVKGSLVLAGIGLVRFAGGLWIR